ncbi:glucan endo-1,3-alpha-glucosidase [Diplogelasinospora grovesii]|uniref:Glucan endo-1,3-alpha-glucosidase n=1 Tax=Diplogelasinospora grovesii TaxID=303347 RepID=A0AAN6S0A9_9PEZI|nr:glucan endo-1,3-alpha-glucosidase [Diplogelasinospora grovesii]
MRAFQLALAVVLSACSAAVHGKAVFAHFMVGNVGGWTTSQWSSDIAVAQAAGIDGFALNVAAIDTMTPPGPQTLANAFSAAQSLGFKLFFSFDYLAQGAWPRSDILTLLNRYANHPAYFQHPPTNQPLVSTFEGTGNTFDWISIKAQTNVFFVPDYSSLGPLGAVLTGVADGLFSWSAWPDGPSIISTVLDLLYQVLLGSKPYMMPVSPWFYTNLPNWSKNWLWRGDSLWFDRWNQVLSADPEYVQIISWNDYGESHYIAPLHSEQYGLFSVGGAPYNYAANMPHDGWRQFLPYLISQYKTGRASITTESLVSWFRLSPANACSTGGTTGNTASQGQVVYDPATLAQDRVFFSALLSSSAQVSIAIGRVTQRGSWSSIPSGGSGIYFGSVPFNGLTGAVTVTISRNGKIVAQMQGATVSKQCTNGISSWNAWVGSAVAGGQTGANALAIPGATPATTLTTTTKPRTTTATLAKATTTPATAKEAAGAGTVCVSGTGSGNFIGLCQFACQFGYCPSPCTCTATGVQIPELPATGGNGYPLISAGSRCAYTGLCSYSCSHGYCPPTACGRNPAGAAGC